VNAPIERAADKRNFTVNGLIRVIVYLPVRVLLQWPRWNA